MALSQVTYKRNLKNYNSNYYLEFVQLATDDTSTMHTGAEWMLCYSELKALQTFKCSLKIVLKPLDRNDLE